MTTRDTARHILDVRKDWMDNRLPTYSWQIFAAEQAVKLAREVLTEPLPALESQTEPEEPQG